MQGIHTESQENEISIKDVRKYKSTNWIIIMNK